MKEEFLNLLRQVKREGIDDLIQFIEKTDFFKAPASTRFHGDHEGGLVEHSMKVYEILKHKVEHNIEPINVNKETLILVPLLHDLCKANFYKVDYRNAKNELGVWEKVPYYTIDDTIPYGHGEKSVMKELYNTIGAAYKKYPLALLMHEADLEATYFYNM